MWFQWCHKRDTQTVKAMLGEWRKRYPGRVETIFRSLAHISPSQLLDRELFDFAGLTAADNERLPDRLDWLRPGTKQDANEVRHEA